MKNLVLVFLIGSVNLVTVHLQDITESSGDSLLLSTSQTTGLLESETMSSGEGPAIVAVLDDGELISESSNNDTDISDGVTVNNNDFLSSNETTLSATVSSTTSSTTVTEIMTSTSTTQAPETTTAIATTTSPATTTTASPTTTTTTMKPTTPPPPPITALPTTTRRTTRRPTTTTTKRMTTKSPLPTTVSNEKLVPQVEAPCEFLENDFVCETELSCFGEGTIDCTITENELQEVIESKHSSVSPADETDYEEESATVGFFPPEFIGRVPPRFQFPSWNHQPLDSASSETPTDSPTVTNVLIDTTSTVTTTTTPSVENETTPQATSTLSSINLVNTMIASTVSIISTPPPNSKISEILEEPSTSTTNNVTVIESLTTEPLENTTVSILVTEIEAMTGSTESDVRSTADLMKSEVTTVLKVRRKRDSNKKDSPSSSQSLKLAVEDSKKQTKSCKVIGNLHCTPMPTSAVCKGRGTCKVISVEKSEKSTSSKGVENWAIAVIAICATAAALTIGLLVYLVVTSWKKLKVQPQNGVTTLNYVNNSPP